MNAHRFFISMLIIMQLYLLEHVQLPKQSLKKGMLLSVPYPQFYQAVISGTEGTA